MFTVEYHWVVLDALNSTKFPTATIKAVFVPWVSICPPVAGYTEIGFVPLLTMITRRPVVAVGNVTPEGLFDVVVMTLKSLVRAPCP